MAIKLEDKPNVVAPDGGDYPFGRIKDRSGTTPGTPGNEEVYGDFHQFFAKLLSLGGVVANGLRENVTNGYQYITALLASVENQVKGTQRSFTTGQGFKLRYMTTTGQVGFVTLTGGKQAIELGAANTYEFNLGTSSANDVVTFGTTMDAGYFAFFYFEPSSGTFTITLNSTNTDGNPQITKSGVTTADTAYTIPTGKTFMVIRRSGVWEIVE